VVVYEVVCDGDLLLVQPTSSEAALCSVFDESIATEVVVSGRSFFGVGGVMFRKSCSELRSALLHATNEDTARPERSVAACEVVVRLPRCRPY
jgi:hypothetical protein